MLLSCILAFFLNYSVFLNTTLNSALTQTMCGNLKVCTLTCWPFFMFTCSCTGLIFVLIVLGSIYCWTWLAIVSWVTIWSGECENLLLNLNLPLICAATLVWFFFYFILLVVMHLDSYYGPIVWETRYHVWKWSHGTHCSYELNELLCSYGLPGRYP